MRSTCWFLVRVSLVLGALVGAGATLAVAQSTSAPAAVVIAEIQARYGAMRSLRARFEQRFVHRLHEREERWRGRVSIARPGLVRIDYQRPRGRVVASDGTTLIAYDPEPAPGQYYEQAASEDVLPIALGLLAGTGDIATDFDARLLETAGSTFRGTVVELRPRRAVPLYERVLLYVDRAEAQRGRIHRILIVDHAGNTNRFDLTDHEENVRLPASTFAFRPPASARRIEP